MATVTRSPYREHLSSALTLAFNRQGKRQAVTRSYIFRALARLVRTIEIESGGIMYFLDPTDVGVSLPIFTDGGFEEELMDEIVAILSRETGQSLAGRGLIDIGANIGTTTALAVKKHGASHVTAFEPELRNCELFRHLLIANGLEDKVDLHRAALSDHDGMAVMELATDNAGDHRVRLGVQAPGQMSEECRKTTSVAVARLDSFDLDFANIGLVWIDVQGHEGHVLGGASRLLESEVPVVAEYWPYMLNRARGLEMFHQLVQRHFRTVIDARTGDRMSADSVSSLANRYPSPTYTDVILLH